MQNKVKLLKRSTSLKIELVRSQEKATHSPSKKDYFIVLSSDHDVLTMAAAFIEQSRIMVLSNMCGEGYNCKC